MKSKILGLLAVGLLNLAVIRADASVVTEFTSGTSNAFTYFVGQSFTVAPGSSYNNVTVNFFSDISGGTTPSGVGSLFLLTQEYLGAPNALGVGTLGFLAQSTGVAGGIFSFDPSLVLLGGTQYFAYSTSAFLVSGANGGGYPGGNTYLTTAGSTNFTKLAGADANFRVSGIAIAVPEPGTLALLGLGLAGLGLSRRRKAN